jgi:enoyl-CoA hydratase
VEQIMSEKSFVLVEVEGPVGLLRLNRPEVYNVLSPSVLAELCDRAEELAASGAVRVLILTGSDKAFAAGADIQAMARASPIDIVEAGTLAYWQRLRRVEIPMIAAVSGYAYGGGCELAMTCDLIVASETACFAQPEIKLGIMPGAGGTQRLARAVGPYRAMEMILTGEPLSAEEGLQAGLVNRVVPVERYLDEARTLAKTIAERPPLAVRMARQAVRHGLETSLREGLEVERRNFTLLFDTDDQKEGMAAFLEKRPPNFTGS